MVESEVESSTPLSIVNAALLRVGLFFQTHPRLSRFLLKTIRNVSLFIFTCGVLYGVNPKFFSSDISSGHIESLVPFVCIFCVSYMFGEFGRLIHVPRILSMIIGGIILGNTTNIKFNSRLSSITRNIAFCTILIEGGTGLNPNVLRKSSRVCLQLCFVPLLAETAVASALGYFFVGLEPLFSILLGFSLSAACAAIIVPNMMQLQKKQLGTEKGIPSMVIAASSMDDVMAIAGFGIFLGYAIPTTLTGVEETDRIWRIIKGPVEIIAGLAFGYLFGTLIGLFPIEFTCSHPSGPEGKFKCQLTRIALIFLASMTSIFVSEAVELAGIGPLSVLTGSFFAALKLRKVPGVVENLNRSMHVIWSLMAPFLFGILGAEFTITGAATGYIVTGLFLVICCAVMRLISTYLCLYGSPLNPREKFFVSIAWLAKAAVQATLAPIVYDSAQKRIHARTHANASASVPDRLAEEREMGSRIQMIAVISVLVTSPIAILGMKFLPKHCLKVKPPPRASQEQTEDEEIVNPRNYNPREV